MIRGRKPKGENTNLNWQEYFNKNVGVYLQTIIIELGQLKKCGTDSSVELLNQIKKEKLKTNKKDVTFPKINPEEIPFIIPKNWVWCRLGEIIEFTDNLNIETKLSKDTLINYVDIDAIDNQNHTIRENKLRPVSELSSRARRVLRKGYIVYSLVRPYLNNIAIVEEECSNHIGSTGFAVFNGILVNNRFLKYILLSDYVRQLYLSMLSGFNSPTITQEQFNLTPIPLPPISEQNKILEFLSDFESENIEVSKNYFNKEVEEKILELHNSQLLSSELFSELSHQLTQIENLNQAILQEAVQGKLVAQNPADEPATELLKRIKVEKEKTGKKEKPLPPFKPEEIPFEIPESWVWSKLSEICANITDGTHQTPTYFKSGYIFLSSKNVTSGKIDWNEIKYIDEKQHLEMHKRVAPRLNDILLAKNGTTGVAALVDRDVTFDIYVSLALLRPLVGIYPNYLLHFVNSSTAKLQFNKRLRGIGVPNLHLNEIREVLIPIPPFAEQIRIVAEIEKQLAKTKQLKQHIIANQQATEQLLKALLHQAFEVGEKEEVV